MGDIELEYEEELVESASAPDSSTYVIQPGDTLSEIVAEHYGLTKWSDIQRVYETVARNNGIENPDLIYAGNSLVLFDSPSVDLFAEPDNAAPGTTVSAGCSGTFNACAEGIVPANTPEPPSVRPMPRPEALAMGM